MKYNPAGNQLVLRPLTQSEQTDSGLFIPETSRKLLDEGIVVEVGPKVDQTLFENVEGGIKEGARVVVRRYSGTWVKLAKGTDQMGVGDDANRLIVEDEDILIVPTGIDD